jgi:PIF1-like helicase/Helix-turn-helix domain
MCYNIEYKDMTQDEALNILKLGHTTFLTGEAGAGKTYVLNKYIDYLKHYNITHAVTASTGIAATHIGGTTIHSWSGMGIKDVISDWDLDMMTQNEKLVKRYINTKILIIDEVSMLHASRLDMLDKVARSMRQNSEPFGGLQVILCGDFFQLPPVVRDRSVNVMNEYAFNSKVWKESKPVICYLTENYRQEDDNLSQILNAIRNSDEDIYDSLEMLQSTSDNILNDAIKLYTHNDNVDVLNESKYKILHEELEERHKKNIKEFTYEMVSVGKKNLIDNLKANILTSEILSLKTGTKVMFIKNDRQQKYQNGTLATVIDFDKDNMPIVEKLNGEKFVVLPDSWQIKSDDDKLLAEVSQIPLRYAWAITIHKSQGMTLDAAEVDLTKGFGFGMGYVALSRVRSLSGLKVVGLNNQALQVAPFVVEENRSLKEKSERAVGALTKYSKEDLEKKHKEVRIKMGGLEDSLSDDELKAKEELAKKKEEKIPTGQVTLKLILEGKNLEEISKERDLGLRTIIEHLCDLLESDKNKEHYSTLLDLAGEIVNPFVKKNKLTKSKINEIKEGMKNADKIKPVYDKYKNEHKFDGLSYEILKIIKVI